MSKFAKAVLIFLTLFPVFSAIGATDSNAAAQLYQQVGKEDNTLLSTTDVNAAQTKAAQAASQLNSTQATQNAQFQQYLQKVGEQIMQTGQLSPVVSSPAAPAISAAAPAVSKPVAAPATPATTQPNNTSPTSSDTQNNKKPQWNYGF